MSLTLEAAVQPNTAFSAPAPLLLESDETQRVHLRLDAQATSIRSMARASRRLIRPAFRIRTVGAPTQEVTP